MLFIWHLLAEQAPGRTSVRVRPTPSEHGAGTLSRRQVHRAWRALCGIEDCACGGYAGERGGEYYVDEDTYDRDDGRPVTFSVSRLED